MKRFQNHSDWLERKEEKNPQVPSRVSIELIASRRSVAKALGRITRLHWRDWFALSVEMGRRECGEYLELKFCECLRPCSNEPPVIPIK
jgi:hypothetical protein